MLQHATHWPSYPPYYALSTTVSLSFSSPSFSQLNATLQPPHCFDANMLKMLPTELIAFGKLQPASASSAAAAAAAARSGSSAAAQLGSSRQLQLQAAGNEKDVLHIGINGLHRWTPQFENHIWKHLGESPPTPDTVATLNRYCASHFRQLIAFCSCPAALSDKSAGICNPLWIPPSITSRGPGSRRYVHQS